MKRPGARCWVILFSFIMMLIGVTGCGSVNHNLLLENGYSPKPGSLVEVGTVSNDTGQAFDFRIEDKFKDELVHSLRVAGFEGTGKAKRLRINCSILDYQIGNAFKRWVLPGWGSTILTVQCKLRDAGKTIGTIDANRTVDFGGPFTIGAWENVFVDVTSDVAGDLAEKFVTERKQAASSKSE